MRDNLAIFDAFQQFKNKCPIEILSDSPTRYQESVSQYEGLHEIKIKVEFPHNNNNNNFLMPHNKHYACKFCPRKHLIVFG